VHPGFRFLSARSGRPRRSTPRAILLTAALFACLAVPAVAGEFPESLRGQLQRIFAKKDYDAKKFGPARWEREGRAFTTVEPSAATPGAKDIVRYDSATGERRVLVPASRLVPAPGGKPLAIDDYAWSKDGRHLLLFTDAKKVWRLKTRGDYWVLDLDTGRLLRLGGAAPEATLMFAKFSPDGRRVAYVLDHDLWVEDVATGAITRLTSDGSDTIINGTSDWVYEEEFHVRDGFRWSPDGTRIAFWHFDDSGVGIFSLINDTDTTYPVVTRYGYPTAGTTNPSVKIGIVPAAGGAPVWVDLPGDPRNNYVPRMEWAEGPTELLLQQMNRLQNRNDVWLADPATGKARLLLHDEDRAWLDVVDAWQWLPGNRELLWVSDRDGWRHVWAAPRSGGTMRLLTPGEFDILKVVGLDGGGGLLYFTASPGDALHAYLYRARLDGPGAPERVTPPNFPGTHVYDLSPDGRFAFHTYSRFDRPPVTDLVRLPAHTSVRVLQDNAQVAAAAAPLLDPPVEFFQVGIGEGVTLDGWMLRPGDFDASKKYPLLMYVYGEPAGAQVEDKWWGDRALFHRALAASGYVVACVDNQGTPAPKGRAWRKIIYGSIGPLATKEQTAAVRRLLETRPYLDPARVASWGWSGGGSMTLNLLFRSPDVYSVGMSVAPVPDQRLYDTIYQERYMGLPQENPEGYRNGSPINFAEGLRGRLLLVHGSGDDNVHFQGSERLVNRLIELEKPFDFMDYPNRTHSISEGEGTSLHLHELLARYLLEQLSPGGAPR
jgi:dipeptidyl-peptidase-4